MTSEFDMLSRNIQAARVLLPSVAANRIHSNYGPPNSFSKAKIANEKGRLGYQPSKGR